MLKLAGTLLDVHDDIGLHLFRELIPEAERQKLAAGVELFSPEELQVVSDHRFGAIFHDSSDPAVPPRRSFLMQTPAHTKLSALYFAKVASDRVFPDPVRNAIAAQLSHGMEVHGTTPEEVLDGVKAAEFREWADQHGEWAPGDNFIDCSLFDAPEAPEVEKYAFSKLASGGMRKFVLPVETADQVLASVGAVLSKTAMDDLGLDADELRKAASAVKYAAEAFEIEVPEALVKMASVDERPREDVVDLLSSRLAYVNADKRETRASQIKTAMAKVLEETKPAALVAKIALLDSACGIGEKEYRKGCARPFDVVFQDGRKVADESVALLESVGGMEHVKEILGEKVAEEFKKAPKATFEKQSKELKHLLLHAHG